MSALVVNSNEQGWRDFSSSSGAGHPTEIIFSADAWNGATVEIRRRDRLTATTWSAETTVSMDDTSAAVTSNQVTDNVSLSGTALLADQLRAVVTGSPTNLNVVIKSAS